MMIPFRRFITLAEFIEEAEKGKRKYVAVNYSDETQERLRDYAKKHGFDLSVGYDGSPQNASDFGFHTTIFFSTTKHDIENGKTRLKEPGTVNAVSYELLGEDKNIPVIRVESKGLNDMRSHYEDFHGMADAWPTYKPHISMSYAKENLPDVTKIPLPTFPLIYDTVVIDDVKEQE